MGVLDMYGVFYFKRGVQYVFGNTILITKTMSYLCVCFR